MQFLLKGKDLPIEEIQDKVITSGEYPLIVVDKTLLRVHVHTMNPDEILNYAHRTVEDIIVEDIDAQVQKKR